jgi:hypothetical protein
VEQEGLSHAGQWRFHHAGRRHDARRAVHLPDREAGMSEERQRRPIWLRREGNYVVVLIEVDGEWREIIREHDADGTTPFSHCWYDRS